MEHRDERTPSIVNPEEAHGPRVLSGTGARRVAACPAILLGSVRTRPLRRDIGVRVHPRAYATRVDTRVARRGTRAVGSSLVDEPKGVSARSTSWGVASRCNEARTFVRRGSTARCCAGGMAERAASSLPPYRYGAGRLIEKRRGFTRARGWPMENAVLGSVCKRTREHAGTFPASAIEGGASDHTTSGAREANQSESLRFGRAVRGDIVLDEIPLGTRARSEKSKKFATFDRLETRSPQGLWNPPRSCHPTRSIYGRMSRSCDIASSRDERSSSDHCVCGVDHERERASCAIVGLRILRSALHNSS